MSDFCTHRCTWMAALLVCLTLFGSLLTRWPSMWNMDPRFQTEEASNTTDTTVLVWTWPFGQKFSLDGNICKERFGIPNCIVVDNRSMYSQADFVIFHNRELIFHQAKLPVNLPRPQGQRWVWFSMESPENNGNLHPFAGKFNCTMSYRRDADIYIPYGRLVPQDFGTGMTVEDFIPQKKSLACWVVSNFVARHRRTAVYNRLKNIIPVDVYGKAVNKPLDKESLLPTISQCYFYLSFENSIFQDYITEKLWNNAFVGGAVPVVLGPSRKQYEAVIPKDSFIHVDDFTSLEKLGEFLKELAKDKERYASYFKWRLNYTVKLFDDWREEFCRTCLTVNSLRQNKVYEDLHDWQWK